MRDTEHTDEPPGLPQVAPWHLRKEVMLDLAGQRPVPQIGKRMRSKIPGCHHLPPEERSRRIGVEDGHPLVVRRERRPEKQPEASLVHRDKKATVRGA